MERIFETGDLVTLTCPDYRDIKKGTLGIVMEPITEWKCLMLVHIGGQQWSFPEHEFVHSHLYKVKKWK
jgi:hypothetical protein